MSVTSQGEGWWMASDGRWYPPHLHPDYLATLPPPPVVTSPAVTLGAAGPVWGTPVGPAVVAPSTPAMPSYPPGYGPPPGQSPAPGYAISTAPGFGVGPIPTMSARPGDLVDPVLALPLAAWWKRLIAIVIDNAIVGTFFLILFVIIGALADSTHTTTAPSNTAGGGALAAGFVIIFILSSIPSMLYAGLMNGSARGQTVGKMAMGIAVRDARTGGKIGAWRGIGRYAITVLFDVLLVIPYVVDSLSPLWDARRQAWHDRAAHSVVIDVRP